MTNLGTVEGDECSSAYAINAKGQVIGASFACDFSIVHAFLWENGRMIALDGFIPPNSGISLTDPSSINERGEIVIDGTVNGNQHAFMLVPCVGDQADAAGCRDASEDKNVAAQDTRPFPIHTSTFASEGWPTFQMLDGLHARLRQRRWHGRSATEIDRLKIQGASLK